MGRLVSFHDAALGYGNTPALTGLTLDVFGGQALALVGPNGGGKTTLMRGIVGGCSILSGTVEVEATRIGLVPQSADLDLTFPVSAPRSSPWASSPRPGGVGASTPTCESG